MDRYSQRDVNNILLKELETFSPIKWHCNRNSFYIKFRDVRLGSIRISDHKGRGKYHYTYEVFVNDDPSVNDTMRSIIERVYLKAKGLNDFDPDKYIVFDENDWRYKEVPDEEAYRNYILKRPDKEKALTQV